MYSWWYEQWLSKYFKLCLSLSLSSYSTVLNLVITLKITSVQLLCSHLKVPAQWPGNKWLLFKWYIYTQISRLTSSLPICNSPSHTECYHVELVRCHEFPLREGYCVVQVCPSSYRVLSHHEDKLLWEWKLAHIKQVLWHPIGNKLEVGTQR